MWNEVVTVEICRSDTCKLLLMASQLMTPRVIYGHWGWANCMESYTVPCKSIHPLFVFTFVRLSLVRKNSGKIQGHGKVREFWKESGKFTIGQGKFDLMDEYFTHVNVAKPFDN